MSMADYLSYKKFPGMTKSGPEQQPVNSRPLLVSFQLDSDVDETVFKNLQLSPDKL